ncbi:hypothetical protein FB480_10779 [Agrobacterium vitis]|nr:hypothetical protein FB480_10779 [Agrobacterium vitis]
MVIRQDCLKPLKAVYCFTETTVDDLNVLTCRLPPHPPAGTFSPLGRRHVREALSFLNVSFLKTEPRHRAVALVSSPQRGEGGGSRMRGAKPRKDLRRVLCTETPSRSHFLFLRMSERKTITQFSWACSQRGGAAL